MARPRASRRPPWGQGALRRLVLLAALAVALAVALHAALGAAGVDPHHPLRLFLTPLLAAAVVALGVGPLPTARRLRLGLLVALGLFFYSLARAF